MPRAIAVEEKTLMMVSEEDIPSFTFVMARLRKMPKAIIQNKGSHKPKSMPIPTPVKALCPNASEKNAILLLTVMVPKSAKRGASNNTAKKAFFIKSYCKKEKGSNSKI